MMLVQDSFQTLSLLLLFTVKNKGCLLYFSLLTLIILYHVLVTIMFFIIGIFRRR